MNLFVVLNDKDSLFGIGHAGRDKNRDSMDRGNAYSSFGSWVRTRRRQLDLTQAELGKRASCSEATIRKIEADERKPSRQLAELLARALSIPANDTERFMQFARGAWLEDQKFENTYTGGIPNNLPGLLTSTIDRVRDHTAVTGLLRDPSVRLVTLIGPPGIGKTRLSIRCGNELLSDFPGGVWFVDLSEIDNPDFFAPALARVLTGIELPSSPGIAQLVRGLRGRRLLLILDNFEQVVEAALYVAQLLKDCPGIKVLVTSRLPLHIYGENEYPLPPLTVPPPDASETPGVLMQYESVQLLVARLRLHQPGFMLTEENVSNVKQMCAILEGIPLALELAAASLRHLSLGEMIRLLNGRNWVARIGSPARDLPVRQRTLENVIEWSYELLDDAERSFYARLGVLSGWFDTGAAAALNEISDNKALELLSGLSDHSLLLRENTNEGIHWRMFETIRAHAYGKLAQPDEVEQLRAEYYLEQMQAIQHNASRPDREKYFIRHLANLHGALAWLIGAGKAEMAFTLASQLGGFWEPLGFHKEGLVFYRSLMLLGDGLQPRQLAALAQAASDLAWQQHDFETALFFSRQSVELGKMHGLASEYPWYLNRLGRIFIEQGKLAEARTILQEALTRSADPESKLNPGIPLVQLGEIALMQGQLDEARSVLQQALLHLDQESEIFIAMATTDLAEVALGSGDFSEAHRWLTRSLEYSKRHNRRFLIFLCSLAGYLALTPQDRPETVAQFYGVIEALSDRLGLPLGTFYQTVNQNRMRIARQTLTENTWKNAFEDGKGWGKEDVVRRVAYILSNKIIS